MSTTDRSRPSIRCGQEPPYWLARTRVKLCGLAALAGTGIGTGAPALATACVALAGAAVVAAVAIQGGLPLLRTLFFITLRPQVAGPHQERNQPDERLCTPTPARGPGRR
ncbi:hypothetical protein Raf01_73230 [Rugosimonospora africana]|uniref:Uncharacterized protein n=1 Tax=Rugosimonospora africana TaxID=556532 RepID=A0A8J3VUV9_9ACTN|nr:hypothetical protein Raf01_73230 [Rugosimonospora africana]